MTNFENVRYYHSSLGHQNKQKNEYINQNQQDQQQNIKKQLLSTQDLKDPMMNRISDNELMNDISPKSQLTQISGYASSKALGGTNINMSSANVRGGTSSNIAQNY